MILDYTIILYILDVLIILILIPVALLTSASLITRRLLILVVYEYSWTRGLVSSATVIYCMYTSHDLIILIIARLRLPGLI